MLTFDVDIWVKIPDGSKLATNDDEIYKLRKSLYRLKHASRNWNNDINQYLIDNDIMNQKLIRETMSKILRLIVIA